MSDEVGSDRIVALLPQSPVTWHTERGDATHDDVRPKFDVLLFADRRPGPQNQPLELELRRNLELGERGHALCEVAVPAVEEDRLAPDPLELIDRASGEGDVVPVGTQPLEDVTACGGYAGQRVDDE